MKGAALLGPTTAASLTCACVAEQLCHRCRRICHTGVSTPSTAILSRQSSHLLHCCFFRHRCCSISDAEEEGEDGWQHVGRGEATGAALLPGQYRQIA